MDKQIYKFLQEEVRKRISLKRTNHLNEMSSMAASSVEGDGTFKRDELIRELQLREVIQRIAKDVLNEERKLRKLIQVLIKEEIGQNPHPMTSMNILQRLLENIIEIIHEDYNVLTTDVEQRNSFRAYFITNVKRLLEQQDVNVGAGQEKKEEVKSGIFIDIEKDEKKKSEGPENIAPEKVMDSNDFLHALDGEPYNETGRNVAYKSFEKVQKQIIGAYDEISVNDVNDRKTFKEFLSKNLVEYFKKWDGEVKNTEGN